MTRYLLSHWRGQLSLALSLWVNLIGLTLLISFAEVALLSKLTTTPAKLVTYTLVSLFITRLIIFPWQLIGFFRAVETDYIEHKNSLKTRGLQALVLLSIVFTLVYSLELIQVAFFYKKQVEHYAQPTAEKSYQLAVSEDQRQLTIKGGLDVGITQATRSIIKEYPHIRSVELHSQGGQIYEGRGLAKVFLEYGLDTIVYGACSSACATAFIGGKNRHLGTEGKLGFHQYKIDISQHRRWVPFHRTDEEQQRDLALFQSRGVKAAFLDKMFDQPAATIWFPDHATLNEAGIIHAVVDKK